MVNVKCDGAELEVEVKGTGIRVMTELCCIVDSVCHIFMEDEENAEEMGDMMISQIASSLKRKVRENAENRI